MPFVLLIHTVSAEGVTLQTTPVYFQTRKQAEDAYTILLRTSYYVVRLY